MPALMAIKLMIHCQPLLLVNLLILEEGVGNAIETINLLVSVFKPRVKLHFLFVETSFHVLIELEKAIA